jgi:hypothetical protein
LAPGKKAAKKHLEYRPEPTSLRLRDRPEKMVPRRLERQERPLEGLRSQRLAALAGETKAGTAKAGTDGKRDRKIQTEKFHRLRAHL